MYQPKLARFMSRDPLLANGIEFFSPAPNTRGYSQGSPEHPYVYVANNPANFADPTGLFRTLLDEGKDEDDTGSGQAKIPKCICGEKTTQFQSITLVVEILDVELAVNVKSIAANKKKLTFIRKPNPLKKTGKSVRILVDTENWKVICCNTGANLRLIYKNLLQDGVNREESVNAAPKPPGPPTQANMMKFAKCRIPVPMLRYGKDKKDNQNINNNCLKLAFPKANFGPVMITPNMDINKCGGGTTTNGNGTP